ncbi:MAG: hypothetical protein MUF64_25255 [Polyangiaceae bacterium]|nr:hypothetical protein [Polyangiaceae bacterium]
MEATSLRRRVAPVVLLVAAAVVGHLLKDAPRQHPIEVALQGDRGKLTRLDWSLVDPEGQEEAGGRWRWSPGQAPAVVRSEVQASPGRWVLRLQSEQGGVFRQEDRVIELRGEAVRVPLRVE